MNKILISCLLALALTVVSLAQSTIVPMSTDYWGLSDTTMTFIEYNGVEALEIKGSGDATIKDIDFKRGTIEFDYYATGRGFCGLYFRRQPGENRTAAFSSEFFYLRAFKIDDIMVPGSVQYAPIIKGTNLWDLLHDYEANALIKSNTWNNVKLVISKKQMKCYLNNDLVLWIPELLGEEKSGEISLEGSGRYANVRVTPDVIEDVPEGIGADVTRHDVRYLRDWEYSPELQLSRESSITSDMFPDSTTTWRPISSERAGLVNLTKGLSSPFIDGERRMTWLRTTIDSEMDQVKQLDLGFSDDVWVFVNRSLLHIDMNMYNQNIAKQPNGRLNLENTTIDLPLRKGSNEVVISVANDFFGWGLVARLNNMNGIIGKMMH